MGEIIKWSWNFGDGNTSVIENPVHRYKNVGIFIVTLNITDFYIFYQK